MFAARTALLMTLALPAVLHAQRTERFTLSGNRVAIYNIAGKITVEAGTGNSVVVEVTRAGADASRLRMEERTVEGRSALCVVYPDERIIYRDRGSRGGNSSWSTNTSTDSNCQGGGRPWRGGGRRIEVRSQGDGVEAWADIRIQVPAGRELLVWEVVGSVDVANVNGTVEVDVAAATVNARGTRGQLLIDTGSGGVDVNGHDGNVSVDVGSGGVTLNDVRAQAISIDAGSGALRGTNVTADVLSFDTGSGSVEFGAVTAKRIRIDTGSGGARLGFLTSFESLDIDTGSGGVTLELPADFGGQLDIATGSGGISTDFPVTGRQGDRNELRGRVGSGSARVTVETGSGGVRLVRRR